MEEKSMPFQSLSKNQSRQKLAHLVLVEGWGISAAARHMGVSRPTARLWVQRAQTEGIVALQERSHRPHTLRVPTSESIKQQAREIKQQHPSWGAKKIHARLWPIPTVAPVCVRTVDRLLAREGLVKARSTIPPPSGRFERAACNQLWQIDYKGLERCWGYSPLSILDDHSRFCLALSALERRDTESLWGVLWQVFGEYGLPECILCDNGDGFNCLSSQGPTLFQARLWRLGIATSHGRPSHPQTQGKVERFHRTLEEEWREGLRQPTLAAARSAWPLIRQEYNWQRPHEALGQRVPGVVYESSLRSRPPVLPAVVYSVGAIKRKVDCCGKFSYRNKSYRAGQGLAGEWVEIREEISGGALFYGERRIAALTCLTL